MDNINNDKINMMHFRKWTEGKNPFLAAMSLMIAGFSKECFELFNSVRKGKRIDGDVPTQADVPMVTIQRILRDKNLTTTELYIRGLEPVRPALEVLSNRNSRPTFTTTIQTPQKQKSEAM